MDPKLAAYNERRAQAANRKRNQNGDTLGNARATKVTNHPCRICGHGYNIQAHHIVHRSQLSRNHLGVHSVDNIMPLCNTCHQNHHTTVQGRIPRNLLTPTEIAFLNANSRPGWRDRWYPT